MTVDELIAALEDTKRLDPTIGGWEVRLEVAVERGDDAHYEASLYDVSIISEPIGMIERHADSRGPVIVIRAEATA